jgi:hypothetical protein
LLRLALVAREAHGGTEFRCAGRSLAPECRLRLDSCRVVDVAGEVYSFASCQWGHAEVFASI